VTRRAGALAVLAAILGVAAWLRVVHLGTPSLWWDELVEIRTADRPLGDVLRIVRDGPSFAGSNGGAMPADYVLLHAYLRAVPVPAPAPERLEAYFRTPACEASIAAVAALALLGRALFGSATGALAALLLATSLPAMLYAAEARPYSLFTLATVLDVAAFAGVVRAPGRVGRWALYLVANLLYVFTGVFGLLVIAVQYGVLGAIALRRRADRPARRLVLASGAALALVVGGYLASTPLGVSYPRNAVVEPLAVTWASLRFFAADSTAFTVAFLVAAPFAVRAGLRRGVGPVAIAIVLAFAALPAIALVIRWKHYYFHPRHVMFLLPLFHLVVAAGVLEIVRMLDPLRRLVGIARTRRAIEATGVAALAVALVAPGLRAFVASPHWQFARTKTLRDVGLVTRDVAASVARLPPGTRYLLLAERDSTANAMLSAYLDWYGLTDRVTLRAPGVPLDRIEPVLREHDGDPTGLQLRPAHGLFFGLRVLLRQEQPIGEVPARVSALGIVGYATEQRGADVHRYWNVSLREPGARAPSPPRS
jgi:hypothetical protein